MALKVHAAACQWAEDRSSATIVIESDHRQDFGAAIEELSSPQSKNLAVGFAAQNGMSDPRLNGVVTSPYAVNPAGLTLDEVSRVDEAGAPLPPQHPSLQPAAYRIDIKVTRKLI